MESYWHYWRQGWKFQLAMLIFNVIVALILVPIAYALGPDKHSYYIAAVPLFVFALVPIGGFLYCAFKPKPFSGEPSAE